MNGVEIALAGYLAFGQLIPQGQQEIVKHAGLQVLHADGAVTLRLKEAVREKRAEGGAEVTTIRLVDELYPFEVTRYVKSWDDCDAVETWVEIRHSEGGPVRLIRADSFASAIGVSAKEVGVLGLTGKWAQEANVSESKVANGQIVELASKAGTRDAWESNAGMMVLFGPSDEGSGNVLGVALEWTGTTSRRIRRGWDGKTKQVGAPRNARFTGLSTISTL